MTYSSKTLRVLHIEDSPEDSQLLERCLQGLNYSLSFTRISGKKELKAALRKQSWDLVLSDYVSQSLKASEALALIRRIDPDLPFILVSQSMGEDVVADLMKEGIEDVVLKNRLERLNSVVRRALREHDIRNKEARAHRLANEAFAAREQMLAIVSHDIKNPLSAIQLQAQWLLKSAQMQGESEFAGEVKNQSERILKITQRLKTLISDLLDQNKGENCLTLLTRSPVDPANLFFEVVDSCLPLIAEKSIVIDTQIPPQTTLVEMDRNKMFQVFCNLLTNAVKFTPEQGKITFGFEPASESVSFWFKDSGKGLPAGEVDRIFEKYWSEKKHEGAGTGLGLFICKSIVEAHGGFIEAFNSEDKGATFRFTIPNYMHAEQETRPEALQEKNANIYVIDDDDDLREVISWALSKEGYSVRGFRDPQEALSILRDIKKAPGLILVDQYMEDMKGGEFLKLKQDLTNPSSRECPAMIISGSPDEVESDVSEDLYDEILSKPLDLENLLGKVREHFRGAPPEVNAYH